MTIQGAQVRMKAAENAAKGRADAKVQADAKLEVLSKRGLRAEAAAAKVRLLVERPGRIHVTSINGFRSAYTGVEQVTAIAEAGKGKGVERAIELVTSGAIKVQLTGEGTSLSLRGAVQRSRIVRADALRRIEAQQKRVQAAEAAASAARKALVDLVRREHEAGAKVAPEAIAAHVGEMAAYQVAREAIRRSVPNSWQIDDEVKDAAAHLGHAKSKSKDPCPCRRCVSEANRAGWAALDAKRKAEDAAKAKAAAKALAAAPKRLFTCPSCGLDSVSPVTDGMVECQTEDRDCGAVVAVALIRSRIVAKSTRVGVVEQEEEGAA